MAGDEVLVRFRPGTSGDVIQRALDELGARRKDEIPELSVHVLELPAGVSNKEASGKLTRNPAVDFAEPNQLRFAAALPNDAKLAQQWGLTAVKARMSWELGVPGAEGSPSIIVAILDTGISSIHEDTSPKLVEGWNAISPGSAPEDDHGHGTFVAGIAAAATNNTDGIAGVAWEARLMPVKVLNYAAQGTVADLVKGMLWAVANGARVINMSLSSCNWECGQPAGSCGDPSKTEAMAMEDAYEQGAVLIAAAGNSCTDENSYPAAYPFVLGVAATADEYDNIAYFSNFGAYIDVAAPGAAIIGPDFMAFNAYTSAYGTSVASPHVAGLAAVLMGADASLSHEDVARIIQQSADLPAGLTGWNPKYGYGRINMYRALTGQLAAPPAGTNFAYVHPNPFSPDTDRFTTFVIDAQAGEQVEIKIYDPAGNLVWETSLSAPADLYYNSPIRWYGKDSNNREMANGVYFAAIKAGDLRTIKKIAVIR